jgi:hypothetical protein
VSRETFSTLQRAGVTARALQQESEHAVLGAEAQRWLVDAVEVDRVGQEQIGAGRGAPGSRTVATFEARGNRLDTVDERTAKRSKRVPGVPPRVQTLCIRSAGFVLIQEVTGQLPGHSPGGIRAFHPLSGSAMELPMTTLRFEPIALQIGKAVSIDRLLGADRLSGAPGEGPDDPALPADVRDFMSCYMRVIAAAWQLLGAPQFARLAQLYERIEEEFMPGGPPMSPVYDSYASQHILGEVPHGVAGETPYTVLARLTVGHARYERLHGIARALAESHFDLYRVTEAEGLSAQLERLRGNGALAVRLTGPFLRNGDRMLARVIPFGAGLFIGDSPYLLRATEVEWLDYLSRSSDPDPNPPPATDDGARARPSPKLTPKQRARLRQQQAAARQKAPDAAVVRLLKHGRSERYWLDYITDGYAGERRGIVYLAGVPDRPETLPHHADYLPSPAEALADDDVSTPRPGELDSMPRLRAALIEIAEREGITARVERELREAFEMQGLPGTDVQPSERPLLTAYCTLGARSKHGLTALEHLERERPPNPEEQPLVESLERGWFSVFRIDRICLDEGLDVLDVLRRKKLRITERSATRQVALGDLIAGWICDDDLGTMTLEGGLLHVRSLIAPLVTDLVKRVRDAARQEMRGAEWRARAAELPPQLILALRMVREHAPVPELRNTSGHALQLARGRYSVRDPGRVRERLAATFESHDGHTFAWQSTSGILLATFELKGDALLVHVNSNERLATAKAHLEEILGDAIARSLDLIEGNLSLEPRSSAPGAPSDAAPTEPTQLPPELAQQIHSLILQRLASMLDQPIDMFKGKTLRQVARSKATRPDAISWLREQQRILQLNPQMKGLDMRPLWSELNLDYQGLETDG